MHLPDHYLDPAVCAASAAAAATALAGGFLRYGRLPQPSVAAVATAAAGIFAAQMVNFPVSGGTSGHLLGGALAAILLGPWPAMVVMTIVLAVQCLLFADGGIATLGANVLNMAVIAPLVGWGVYRLVCGDADGVGRRMIAAALAGWASVMSAAVACSLELSASGAHSFGNTLAAMASIHAVIGLSEAFITAAVVALATQRSEVWRGLASPWLGLAAAVGIVVILAPFASALPDGLEHVAEQLRFGGEGSAASPIAIMPDYAPEGLTSPGLATIFAGLIGVAACAVLTWAFCRVSRSREPSGT